MHRYLPFVASTKPGRVAETGFAPTADRVRLDYATWHARLAGHNGPAAPATVRALPAGRRPANRAAA